MDIQLEKSKLMKMLEETNDIDIIKSIKKIFKREKKDFWEELTQEQRDEINLSLKEFDDGKYSDFYEFITPYLSK